MNVFRSALLLALLGSALAARANLLTFDTLASGAHVGNAYLASDGASFVNGTALQFPGSPSSPNVLVPDDATLTVNSPVNALVSSVGLFYSSNSVASGPNVPVPTLSVYSGQNGTGSLLASIALPDTPGAFANYAQVSLPFAGQAHSLLLSDAAFSHILYDNLSFTPQAVPEPGALAAFGLGATVLVRRRRKG